MQERLDMSPLTGSALPPRLLGAGSAPTDLEQILLITLRLASRLGDETLKDMAMNLGRQPLGNRRYLRRDALADEIGPSAEAVRAVEDFCRQSGFTLKRRALGNLFLTIEGAAGKLARAFGVELDIYNLGDRAVRAYAGPVSVPTTLMPHVHAILGLDDVSQPSTGRSRAANLVPPLSMDANSPITVAFDYYQYPRQVTGQGAIVAFIESSLQVDLVGIQEFFTSLELGSVTVVLAETPEAMLPPDFLPIAPKLNGEAMMDLKLTGAVAPGATLVAYGFDQSYGFSSDPWIDALIAALNDQDYPCNVMSISLGQPEWLWAEQKAAAVDFLFAIAGLLGVTVCVASGDYGAPGDVYVFGGDKSSGDMMSLTLPLPQNCACPASSPFCLACGGTELLLKQVEGKPPALTGEIAWNSMTALGQKAATGGGISMLFPVPEYQQPLTLPAPLNPGQGPGRGVPDVASNASGLSGYALFPGPVGDGFGTSAAAPMWAALIALLIEKNKGEPIGYLNPLLYSLQLDGHACCTPIVTGDNGPPGSPISFPADAPWNACCGLGSPLGSNLATALGLDPGA